MGLPSFHRRSALRVRPNPSALPRAIWPLYLAWRGMVVVLALVWRAPEVLVPALHRRRELRRCHRDLDRAIADARRHLNDAAGDAGGDAVDAPFETTLLPPPRSSAIVLSFPVPPRAGEPSLPGV